MKTYETNLAERGITTVPKALRNSLGLSTVARLAWTLNADGTLLVTIKYVYGPRANATGNATTTQTGRPDAAAAAQEEAKPALPAQSSSS